NSTPVPDYTVIQNLSCGSYFSMYTCQALMLHIPSALTAAPGTLTVTVTNPTTSGGGGSDSGMFVVYPNPGTVTQFAISGIPNPAVQNTNYNMTVTAEDANGVVVPGYRGIVSLTDNVLLGYTPAQTFTPASPYQFTAGDNGVHTFSTAIAL